MKILVIGSGGRENAIVWKLSQSSKKHKIYCAPGNPGIEMFVELAPIQVNDLDGLLHFALEYGIDLTIVGPEIPLALGIVDLFNQHNLKIFGPTKSAAQLETSKAFAKDLLKKYLIPTGDSSTFDSYTDAKEYVDRCNIPIVVKADGLASGKGVYIAKTRVQAHEAIDLIMKKKIFGTAGNRIIIEEYLSGEELSVFAFTDGKQVSNLIAACDYKQAYNKGQGPNTGGMGSYSPPGFWTSTLEKMILNEIVLPTLRGLEKEGIVYKGILYVGLIMTSMGPKVLEFNCRFGDPECQVILPRLETDLIDVILSVINQILTENTVKWSSDTSIGVVMASKGYPGNFNVGYKISGHEQLNDNHLVFHSGTKSQVSKESKEHILVTAGGRVLTLVSLGKNLKEARDLVYQGIDKVAFTDSFYRIDIGQSNQANQ